jgi:hypothetical protein
VTPIDATIHACPIEQQGWPQMNAGARGSCFVTEVRRVPTRNDVVNLSVS